MIPPNFSIVQYQAVGSSANAKPFNDAEKVAGFPATFLINKTRSITKIAVKCAHVIDHLTVTYMMEDGKTQEVGHGGSGGKPAQTIELNADEVLIGVSGSVGNYADWGLGTCLITISFAIFNTKTEVTRLTNIFGGESGKIGTPFYAERPIAFAGYAREGFKGAITGLSFVRIL